LKNAIAKTLLILLFLGLLASAKHEMLTASSTMIKIPSDYSSIQEAINNANAGDTIYVYNGTYHEHLEVNKSISIIGQNPNITIIDGDNTGTVVHVSAANFNLVGFTLRNAWIGIHLYECSDCTIEKNIIEECRIPNISYGIKVELSKNITIRGNNVKEIEPNCIFFLNSNSNCIYYNNITSNYRWSHGLMLYNSSNNVISHNLVNGDPKNVNEGGISLLDSQNNSIINNLISYNQWSGLSLQNSNNTFVWGNSIVGHNWWGMMLDSSYNNRAYCNNFVENTYQVTVKVSNATWYSAGMGNYWSDHVSPDNPPDGIGDEPYAIDSTNTDNYPLMGKFSDFTVFNETKKANDVTIISNSTISDFTFTKYFNPEIGENISLIKFSVAGDLGHTGFCRICIPHALLQGPYGVTVDDSPPIMIKEITSNLTQTTLYFTYYNPGQVIIVPELSLALFLCLIILISLFVTLIKTEKFKRIASRALLVLIFNKSSDPTNLYM
jgi:parallel beta-helix repeat protein